MTPHLAAVALSWSVPTFALFCLSFFLFIVVLLCAQLTVLSTAVVAAKFEDRGTHLIEYMSRFFSSDFGVGEKKVTICRSPKSGANFFALGNFEEQVSAAYARAQPAIAAAKAHRETAPVASLMPLFAWMGGAQ